MFLNYLLYLCIICALGFVLSLLGYSIVRKNLKGVMTESNFIALITAFMLLYVLFALLAVIFLNGILNKSIMLLFALSPFIIGRFATYEKEKFFTLIQVLCMIASVVYIMFVLG